MDNVLFCQVSQAEIYVAYGLFAVPLLQCTTSAHHLSLEISFVTNLRHNVAVVCTADDVIASEDVGMTQCAKNLYL